MIRVGRHRAKRPTSHRKTPRPAHDCLPLTRPLPIVQVPSGRHRAAAWWESSRA